MSSANREPVLVADLAGSLLDKLTATDRTERTPVFRTGERPEIPREVRRVIHMRDGWKCRWCGWRSVEFARGQWTTDRHLNLDHVVPWSAGGADRSTNLRTLCNVCNELRSNERSDMALVGRLLPVVLCCDACDGADAFDDVDGPAPYRPPVAIDVYCGRDGMLSRHGRRLPGHMSWTVFGNKLH